MRLVQWIGPMLLALLVKAIRELTVKVAVLEGRTHGHVRGVTETPP